MSVKNLIGKKIPPFEIPIERGKIKEFAEAIGDPNPVYYDLEYAQKKIGGILAPPTFTTTKFFWQPFRGTAAEVLGLDGRYVLHGEEEFEYFQPILAGDVLKGEGKVVDAYEKTGKRGGTMIFVRLEYVFYNQRGEEVLRSSSTMVQTGGAVKG